MALEVGKREGPSIHFGTTWGGRKGSSGERPSVARTREGLQKVFKKYSPESLNVIQTEIERAKKEVGEDPEAIAGFLEEKARTLMETSKAVRELGPTLNDVADAIRSSRNRVN